MKRCNLSIVTGILAILLLAGCGGAIPEVEWNKTFGGTGNDEAKSVQQTSDGGNILAGNSNNFGSKYIQTK